MTTGAEWAAAEYRAMLGASLAKRVRDDHGPDCACGADEALTEPINPKEAE